MKRLFITILCIFALVVLATAQTAGENFDVTHYEIRLWDIDFTSHTIQGEAFIDVTVTSPTNTFVLELKRLNVTDVATESYDVVNYNQNGDFLTIVIDETLSAGTTLTLDVRYGGNTFSETWGGVEWWGDYVYNLGVGFDSQPHNLGKTWFPCVDNFTDKASYSLYITVTNDKKAICGGNLINTFNNGDGTTTWHWETPQEIATYHISFAIGNYELWEDVYHGIERDIPVEVYVKPSQMANVPGTFTHIKEIASFYETCLGPYPFNRIGYVCTGKGCMEHIDNIAITSGIITGNTTQEEYLAHELSHMYFGNKVTCSTAGDMWLNEGFAQFWGVFYRSGVYGETDYQQEMSQKINAITSWCSNQTNWIPLNNMPLNLTYDSNAIYDRGAVIVNTLMHYMGRDLFLAALGNYLNSYSYGAASSEQLRDALTAFTGIDMNGFFDTYVFVGGMPHYNVNLIEVTPNNTHFDAKIKLNYWHVGPSHVGQNNRVEITFIGAEGQLQTELIGWDGIEAEQTVSIGFEPIAAFADYYNHFLDAKYDNNLTASEPTNLSQGKFKAIVNSVSDSIMLRIEDHLIGPDDDPEMPALTLSTSHFWNFFRNDFGDTDVSAQISFSNSLTVDGDIIQTENDSAVLLYRANVMDPWHTIPYTQEGNWKYGRFTVSNPQSGQYTIGAIDKLLLGTHETSAPHSLIYPNPTTDKVTLQWNNNETGQIQVLNQQLQVVKLIPYNNTNQFAFDVSDLTPGIYFVKHNSTIHKLIIVK